MKRSVSLSIIGAFLLASLWTVPVHAVSEAETAELLVKLMQAGRTVITGHQDLINDPTKGDKGFTPQYMAERVIQKYKEVAQVDLSRTGVTPQHRLLLTLLDCGKEVVAEAQPIINKQGVGFKGFIPAKWGRLAGGKFTQRTGIVLKLTAQEYRHPGNRPDEFENEILKMFTQPTYPKGRGYSRVLTVDGKPVLRYMAPEYANGRCLQCHGEPRGIRDISGFKREGYREGDVAGAISLILPIQSNPDAIQKLPTSRKKGGASR
jgi:uncharacterized protein DUF3365